MKEEGRDIITESIAILAITLCMIVIFVRSKHADYAFSTVPILIVPAMHLLAMMVLRTYGQVLYHGPYQLPVSLMDIVALAISCLCIIGLSTKVKNAKNKKLYIALLSGYNIILTCAYVSQLMHPILMRVVMK